MMMRRSAVLNMERNQLESINDNTFSGLFRLHTLILSENRLKLLTDLTLEGLVELAHLRLDFNQIFSVDSDALRNSTKLKDLHLSNNYLQENKIRTIENGAFDHNHNLKAIRVDDNVLTNVHGLFSDLSQLKWLNLSKNHLEIIRVYMHAKHGVRLFYKNDRSEDSSKVFDAFVSYSSKDEVFVTQILAPELERGSPSYKLCLHYRDFPVGAYVTDSILSAVESSKRTVLILSDNFIKSEWMRYEFRSAHHEVLRDRCRRLIVILLGEVSMGDLDPDLRLYLKTNTWLRLNRNKLSSCLTSNKFRRSTYSTSPHIRPFISMCITCNITTTTTIRCVMLIITIIDTTTLIVVPSHKPAVSDSV
ncbi:hypothetical protein HAZT_HAZT003854 [Hyalella azteca]|uniref:TIR domain-containing protein n=1 Tax=Hyalella azteca TaxID=294128 RepID=A0A6A0GYE9_HYAAZ|nr:hypothetical protein HAZT_HAZT003854 [Hyalella azteca]